MSDNNHGARPPEKKKKKSGKSVGVCFLIAAGALALCWYYVTTWATLQIDTKHSQDCLIVKGIAWVVDSRAHELVFAVYLALPLIIGFKLKSWGVAYYRLLAIVAIAAVAGIAWDLSSPGEYFTSFVNKLLDVNFFDRS